MLKSLINRRQQMVGDALQLDLDAEHWNNINPNEVPIQLPLDFTDDVEWAKNARRNQMRKLANFGEYPTLQRPLS